MYLINRMPLISLGNISPYEKLYGVAPNNAHLRAYYCLCFVSTLSQGRKKFEDCADLCIFLGYPFGQKAYKVYNMKTKSVIISRDVLFHENVFPYHLPSNSTTFPLPFYLPLPTNLAFETPNTSRDTLTPHTHSTFYPTPNPPPTPNTSTLSSRERLTPLPTLPITSNPNATLTSLSSREHSTASRHITRLHNPPPYLQQYVCNIATSHSSSIPSFVEPLNYKAAV